MAAKGPGGVLVGYLKALLVTVLFPLLWIKALALAGRHDEADPSARTKVLAGIVAGVVLFAAGAVALVVFEEAATAGIYDSLEGRLEVRTLEQEYIDQVAVVGQKEQQIPRLRESLDDALRVVEDNRSAVFAGDPVLEERFEENRTTLLNESATLLATAEQGGSLDTGAYDEAAEAMRGHWQTGVDANIDDEQRSADLSGVVKTATDAYPALATAIKEQVDARERRAALEEHHAFFGRIQPDIEAREDAAVRAAIVAFNSEEDRGSDAINMDRVDAAFAIKDDAVSDMQVILYWFLWPSVIGLFYAPLAFALGSVLRKAWVPSETVGFKPYPGAAAGWFLLFGAFGVPSVPFAAWTFYDMEIRSEEGQIAL